MAWASIDGSAPLSRRPASDGRPVRPHRRLTGSVVPILSEEERAAHKVHKIAYDVALEVPPFRVVGTVFLYPGSEPARLMDRATEMFVPLIDAVAFIGDRQIGEDVTETILVNRFYLRGIEQIDRRTMAPHVPLPGQPLGGISWQDKSDDPVGRGRSGSRPWSPCGGPDQARAGSFARPNRRNPAFAAAASPAPWAAPGSMSLAASSRKSSVTFSLGNRSMTVRPSLAALTKSRPPERMSESAGIPMARSMSSTPTPLLARFTTIERRSRMPRSAATSR
jgi:hypothetical protein